MGKIDYQAYLRSRQWQTKRKGIVQQLKTCVLCDSKQRLEVHHRHYRTLGCEDLEDVTVLCHTCHTRYHTQKQLSEKRAKKWTLPKRKKLKSKPVKHSTTKAWIVTFCLLIL